MYIEFCFEVVIEHESLFLARSQILIFSAIEL